MNIEKWKALNSDERNGLLNNPDLFNVSSDYTYDLVSELGRELKGQAPIEIKDIEVLNRFGELIIGMNVAKGNRFKLLYKKLFKKLPKNYYGFRVFYYEK